MTEPSEKYISVIVPCFNEEEALPAFYSAVTETMRGAGLKYELIFIDDGSTDGTLYLIRHLAEKDHCVFYYSFSRNFGKEAAMYAGLCHARGDYTAVMDADMQDPPSLLPEMVKVLDEGEYDCVATRRSDRRGEPAIRSLFARLFYRIINRVSDADIMDGARDFRLMRRKMVNAVVSMGRV